MIWNRLGEPVQYKHEDDYHDRGPDNHGGREDGTALISVEEALNSNAGGRTLSLGRGLGELDHTKGGTHHPYK